MTAGTDTPTGWTNTWTGQGKIAVARDTRTFKSGPAALRVATSGRARGQVQQLHDAPAGATVRFAGYLKTAGSLTATVGVMAYTAEWKGIGFQAIDQGKNTSDWHPFAGTVTLPPKTAHFGYVMTVEGDGTAWLDEVTGDPAAYQKLAAEAKTAVRKPAGPHPDTPPRAPNAWTAGEGFYADYPKAWRQVHDGFVERTRKGGIELIFFGDSITQGWNDQKELWAKYYAPRRAVNYGIGGDGTPQVLWRIEHGEVDGLRPKAVVLMIGTNNRWRGDATPETISRGVEAILTRLKAKLPETKVLLLGVFPTGPKPDHPDRALFTRTNRRLAALADDRTVFFLDLTDRFLEKDGTITREMMPDYLHLSTKGYRIWAEAMEPKLKAVLGE
ncbi:MAG: GDSL-type esterase/lipase family protein [Gemmataceae bacterium]